MKTHAIRINEYGGPDVLQLVEVEVPELGPGEARVRHTAIGLNFIDTYHRSGLYPGALPSGLGSEAAGIVEAVGDHVTDVKVGDRVVYTGMPADSYSEVRNFPAARLVQIPEGVSDEQAAATLLKGLTAWYLLHHSYPVKPGDNVLLYAAAGGVGLLAAQWARHLGVRVIGVVSTEEKAALARANGCAEVIMANDDVPACVREMTAGVGVAAVYDSVGKDTFMASLDCLRPHGVMVTFGNASGPVAPFAPAELAKRHSLYVTRPVLFDFVTTRPQLLEACGKLFEVLGNGAVKVSINQRYSLRDAATAHRDLEARKTSGSTILVP